MHSGLKFFPALAVAVTLSGCGNIEFGSGPWFQKPLDLFGHQGGYTYSELQETRQVRPITANDFVQANGACPLRPAPAAPPQPPALNPATPTNSGPIPPPATGADTLLGGGVALGMSECDVVDRGGPPSGVQLGQNPNGDRTAVLTFDSGPRPGIYRFERGRLMEIDEVAVQPPPPVPPRAAKKKHAKTKKRQEQNS